MVNVRSFTVSGFRAISEPLTLDGLGGMVFLYGDNATGKSSVLDALRVFGQLCQTPGRELFGLAWDEEVFFERFNLDGDAFNRFGGDCFRLEGRTDEGVDVAFAVERSGGPAERVVRIRAALPLMEASHLNGALDAIEAAERAVDPGSERYLEVQSQLSATRNALDGALQRWDAQAQHRPRVAAIPSPVLPVRDELRERFGGGWRSRDLAVRRRVRAAVAEFGALFPALGQGTLEPTDNPPRHDADVAWIGPDFFLELDHLGGGPQSAFGTLAEIALAGAHTVCLEEPEAFVGERAFPGLRAAVQSAVREGVVAQVWIATHAISLAGDGDRIFILDREGGVTRARAAGPDALARFAPSPSPPQANALGRLGVDGSVRLPPRVVSEMGLHPGDFIYVVQDEHGFRLVDSEQMQRLLDGES